MADQKELSLTKQEAIRRLLRDVLIQKRYLKPKRSNDG